jgi:uncharacterized Rmd1/YagE family protein
MSDIDQNDFDNLGRPLTTWEIERKMNTIEKRVALLEQSTQTIKDELGKINSNISKLVWIVMTAVILAGLNLLFQQGLLGAAKVAGA